MLLKSFAKKGQLLFQYHVSMWLWTLSHTTQYLNANFREGKLDPEGDIPGPFPLHV